MSIAIHPELESKIRSRAEAQGLSIEAYLERLIRADQQGTEELESLALGAQLRCSHRRWVFLLAREASPA